MLHTMYAIWCWLIDPQNLTAISTAIIAAFTIVLACVTRKQARLTRAAVEIANKEFAATHRPKIIVYGLKIQTRPDGEAALLAVQFRYVNAGDSDAEITGIGTKLIFNFKPTLPSEIAFKYREITPPIEIKTGEHGFRLIDDDYDVGDQIIAGKSLWPSMLCFGYIKYRDGNGTLRQTGFCREYDAPSDRWTTRKDDEYEYSY